MTGKITGALREQSDWEQNDENRLGFIKNKPFYDTRKEDGTGELKTIDPKYLPNGGGDIEHIYVHNADGYGLYYAASNMEDNQCVMTLPSEIVSQVKGALERGKALFWHETYDMHGMIEKNSTDILFYNSMQVSVEGITRNMFLVLVPDFTRTGTFAMVGIALTDDENGIMQVQSYGGLE